MQKNANLGKIDKHNFHVSIVSLLILLIPTQNGSGGER